MIFIVVVLEITNNNNIKGNYLDEVSITTATKHIWSFARGCSCGDNNCRRMPRFVREKITPVIAINNCWSHSSVLIQTPPGSS